MTDYDQDLHDAGYLAGLQKALDLINALRNEKVAIWSQDVLYAMICAAYRIEMEMNKSS